MDASKKGKTDRNVTNRKPTILGFNNKQRQINQVTNRQTDRLTDRLTNRQTDRQTDRQTLTWSEAESLNGHFKAMQNLPAMRHRL